MCLYSGERDNGRYKPTKKNGGFIPPVLDKRALTIQTKCGKCIECKTQKARGWQVRLLEDIKTNTNGIFVTLTFNTESLRELKFDVQNYKLIANKRVKIYDPIEGYKLDNAICKRAMRLFNERWRKKYKKAIRHWMVTELGHVNTEHVHLHGIIFTNEDPTIITDKWRYGYTWLGDEILGKIRNYVNEATVNYIMKYVSKMDFDHPNYEPIILTSPGIGKNYTINNHVNKFKGAETDELYRTSTGHKINMPAYWRNKLYTDEERETLWMMKLDKNIKFIRGEKVKADDAEQIRLLREYHRQINKELGFGGNEKNYDAIELEVQRRIKIMDERLKITHDKEIRKQERERRKALKAQQ